MTDAHILFGANEGEGIMAFDMMLDGYIKPNGLIDNEDFFKFDVVRVILGALSKNFESEDSFVTWIWINISGVRDDTSALSDALISKYLGYAVDSCQMGNYTAMIPGLIDVNPQLGFLQQRKSYVLSVSF